MHSEYQPGFDQPIHIPIHEEPGQKPKYLENYTYEHGTPLSYGQQTNQSYVPDTNVSINKQPRSQQPAYITAYEKDIGKQYGYERDAHSYGYEQGTNRSHGTTMQDYPEVSI